ncbi:MULTISPECIES: ABC transporter substrate-binding protein [Paenibacillus]|uniref:ABC transporter substrate-binding protein n=1 Tax=Paenibacillus TaxID=44249 RepID=UPI0019165532|nr:ABC transporter substrate-binding protein [Paenibacillus sp. EPM92]
MQKKLVNAALLASLFVLALTGCSGQPAATNGGEKVNDGAKAAPDSGGAKKVVTMWTRENGARLLEAAVKKYNEENKSVEIKVTSIPTESFNQQFTAALSSNSVPDIVSVDLVLAPYYSSIGAFKDITQQYNGLSFKDQLSKSMLNQGQKDGKQFALPFNADVSAFIYNKAHFRDAGLDPEKPPVTWKELQEYSKKLTNKDRFGYVYGGGTAGTLMFTFMPYVWGNGGEFLNKDGTKAMVNSSQAIEALQFLSDLTNKDKVVPPGSPTYTSQQAFDAFTSGKASMMVNGNFRVSDLNLKFSNIEYGVGMIPKNEGKGHASFGGGELIAITSGSKQLPEAWKFIEFALSKEVQVETFAKNGSIPVRKDFYNNPYFDKEPKYKMFAQSLDVAVTPFTTKYNELYDPILSNVQSALLGKTPAKDAFTKAAADMDAILQKK